MNLLVLCPHLRPDVAPTGEVMSEIVEGLAARGHRLHVVTSLPWYRHHHVDVGWDGLLVRHEDRSWGRVSRVHPFPTDKANIPARALAFGGFTALAALEGALSRARPDVVLAMSPPLTLGPAGWAVAQSRRVPLVFNVQDVFPDVAVELGLLTDRRAIAVASWLERETYRRADAVTVLSEELADNVRAKVPGETTRVEVIPNFADTERIRPRSREGTYRAEHGLQGKQVVMYAGNVGFSQSLDLLVEAARALADRPEVVLVVNGAGSALEDLRRRAEGLDNLRFVGLAPREQLPEVLAAADIHVVPLRTGLARSSVPSKLYSILAAGRPVVASVDPGTEVDRTVARAGAGLTVAPDDAAAFVGALRRLLDDPDEAEARGAAGRRWVEGWASPAAVATAYERLFEALVEERHLRTVGLPGAPGRGRSGVRPAEG